MYKHNMDDILDFLGVSSFYSKGITGKGIKFLELEGNSRHCRNVKDIFSKIAPNAEVFNYSVSNRFSGGELIKSNIDDIIDYAIENKINIIGASVGGSNHNDVLLKFKRFIDYGGILVTSSGNENDDINDTRYYANSDLFISVGACSFNDDIKRIKRKKYSNYGIDLDFILPTITLIEGTSYTAPILSGMIALLLEIKPLRMDAMVEYLKSIAIDLGNAGFDEYYGYGIPILDYDKYIREDIKEMKNIDINILDGQLTENFNLKEFRCKGNKEFEINKDIGLFINHVGLLQAMREWYGRPMHIISGYRTKSYNKACGGVTSSRHLKGLATDISLDVPNFKNATLTRKRQYLENMKNKWYSLCRENGTYGGVGFYYEGKYKDNPFIHFDSYDRIENAFWEFK